MTETAYAQRGDMESQNHEVATAIIDLTDGLIAHDEALRGTAISEGNGTFGAHVDGDATLNAFPGSNVNALNEAPAITFTGHTSQDSLGETKKWGAHLYGVDPVKRAGGKDFPDVSLWLVAGPNGEPPVAEVEVRRPDDVSISYMINANLAAAQRQLEVAAQGARVPLEWPEELTTGVVREKRDQLMGNSSVGEGWRQKNISGIDPLLTVNDFLEVVQTEGQDVGKLSAAAQQLQTTLDPMMVPSS